MVRRWTQLLGEAYDLYKSGGRAAAAHGAFRYSRERLPINFWPQLLLDPIHAADETISLHQTPSIQLQYDGQFRDSLPRQLAAAEGQILGAEGDIYIYHDAEIIGRRPVVRVDGGYFPPSWLGVETAFFIHQEKYLKRNLPLTWELRAHLGLTSQSVLDTGFLLLGERSLEFPNWHHEVLPKLQWLEEYEELTGESPTLIVSADLKSFHKKSLQLMGYSPDSWVDPGNGSIRVRKLLIPPHPRRAKGTHLHTSSLDWIAERILSNIKETKADFPDRIFISRRDAKRRLVQNEDEVIKALRSEGFEWYEPGRLSYEEEIQLFAGADIVVGAHGMGLASMFYADDAAIVELFPEGGATEHYFLTAKECGFEYEFLSCEPLYNGRNIRSRDRDFIVDVDELLARVSSVAASTEPTTVGI